MLGPQFSEHSKVEAIDAAIDSYPAKVAGMKDEAAPYNRESLAEIYSPRVQQLFALQAEGFTHARWGYDPEQRVNRWHGQTPPSGER